MLEPRTCNHCQKQYQPWRKDQKHCNRVCGNRANSAKHNNPPLPKISCATCEKEIHPRTYNQKYCSRRCKIRGGDLASRYGLTPEEYKAKLRAQDGKCAACHGDMSDENRTPALDHCHDTGKVRDFLHTRCNCGIGGARDDQETLFKWQVYLAKHQFDLRDLCQSA